MAGIGSILGGLENNTLVQIVEYNVAGTVLGGLLAPEAAALSQVVWAANPAMVLSPADLASAVVRGELTEAEAAAEAAKSGIDAERFHTLARITGQAIGPGDAAIALRRGIIDAATFDRAIRQGNLRDEWAATVKALSVQQPSPTAMLQAELEGQLTHEEALARYVALGGDPDYYAILFDTEGQAPSPVEALQLANRGIIPWTGTGPDAVSYEQSFLEGPWRNKWLGPFRALGEYLPPPRTVTAMYKEGSLTDAQATDLLVKQGLTADLAAAYLRSGSAQKTAKTKDLGEATIVTLYRDKLVDGPTATTMLVGLGYDAQEAGFLLAIADLQLAERYLSTAVGRVHTLYVGHKIDQATATAVLNQLGLPTSGISQLIDLWSYERAANVRVLTPAEIAGAMHDSIIDQASAQTLLEQQGYLPHDAWLYLSVHEKRALPDEPPQTSAAAVTG